MQVQDLFIGHGKKSVCENKEGRRRFQAYTEIPSIDYSLGMLIPYG